MNAIATTLAITEHATSTTLALPAELRFNDWRRLGDQLEEQRSANLWWIADWAAYGERTYRRDYGEALERIWTRDSIQNLAYVARNVESSRRRDDLSFSHHAEVASLEPDLQNAFLADAFDNGWSRNDLRERIAAYKAHQRGTSTRTPALTIRLVDEARDRALAEAERAHVEPAEYVARGLLWLAEHGNPHLATELATR